MKIREMNVEYRGEAHGLAVLVRHNFLGYRCGYVGVPKGHPLYGTGYDKAEDMGLHAHGGLTFAGEFEALGDGLWYLGFDCAHAWDAPDPDLMTDEWVARGHARFLPPDAHMWTLEEVKDECEDLAKQISGKGGFE